MQVLLGVLQRGCDLHGRLASVPQLDGQPHQQALAQADIGAVHKQHVVHVDKVSGQSGALPGAGQLMGQEDAQHLVPGSGGVLIEPLEQLRAGLAGGGQLLAGGQLCIIFRGGLVKTVPEDGAVLQRDVEGDDGHAQLRGLCGQDIGRGIGENADHKIPPWAGAARNGCKTTEISKKSVKL